jgi:peptidoglycan/xylan/chitin deacetylase (PgdA/CDA1 family)
MIFRDDDISVLTDLPEFMKVDSIFKKYGVQHTIAVIVKDIENNAELVGYIKANSHIKVQLHCWEHIKFTENHDLLKEHFALALAKLKEVFNVTPTILYPPWNESDERVEKIARSFGLIVSTNKITLSQYLRVKGQVAEDTINFHYWHDEDAMLIDPALRIYSEIQKAK